ncbi:MAG TPA: hypothetical protein VKO85_04815 [Wenzhouxiangellaceae bacterium]|nr:hypothetical protein [Wenzhouxiangellaceae bacterium]
MKNASSNNADIKNRSPKMTSALFALLFALGGGAVLTGCEQQGPAEEAGEEVDEAVEEAEEEIDEAAEEAGDAVEEAADEVEEETDDN